MMAIDDRKRKIWEHLAKSLDSKMFETDKKNLPTESIEPTTFPSSTTPKKVSTTRDPQKNVMEHLKMSSFDFGKFSLTTEQRDRKIRDHIRKSIN